MRIVVISAYPAVRAGLAALVRGQPSWSVVGEATPEAAARQHGALSNAVRSGPEVLLADLDGITSTETVEQWLAALVPTRGIVALDAAGPAPGRGMRGGVAARVAGGVARAAGERGLAFGLLRRDASEEEILAGVAAVASGLITVDPTLADLVLAPSGGTAVPAGGAVEQDGDPLTARELEVLQLLAQGLPNKLIAQRLRISEHTAKFHVSAILMKLGAASRTEAATTAARRGLLIL